MKNEPVSSTAAPAATAAPPAEAPPTANIPTPARGTALAGVPHIAAPTNSLERACLSAGAPEATGLATQPTTLPWPVTHTASVTHATSVPYTTPVSHATTPQLLSTTLRPAAKSLS